MLTDQVLPGSDVSGKPLLHTNINPGLCNHLVGPMSALSRAHEIVVSEEELGHVLEHSYLPSRAVGQGAEPTFKVVCCCWHLTIV